MNLKQKDKEVDIINMKVLIEYYYSSNEYFREGFSLHVHRTGSVIYRLIYNLKLFSCFICKLNFLSIIKIVHLLKH